MGFFSGVRRRIKKLIPKEVRPYVPYIAAAIPGMGPFASTALRGYGAAANSFLTAAAAKGLSDDEADLKDILRTGTLAAAPQAIGQGLGQFGEKFGNPAMEGMGNRGILETLGNAATKGSKSNYLNPDFSKQFGDTAKTVALQGATDYGLKAAELNEDALADYNRMMAEQGINDKAGRRAAIRAIYSNTGTWDMDEVDSMLDTYGYRTGGRVGYEDGGSVITLMDGTTVQIPEGSYTSSGSLKDRIYSSSRGDLLREEIIRELSFAKGGRVGYEDGEPETERQRRKRKREEFDEGFEYAKEGLDSLEALEDKYKPMPIRELRLARGGDVMDINMEEQINTPSGDMMMDENVEVASNPEVMDSLNELSLMLFRRPLSDLSEDEYEELKNFAGQTSLKPGLIDEYRNYKYNAEEQGQTPMAPRDYFRMEFGAARMGVARGGIMDVNTNMQLDIPDMGREDVDVNEEMLMAGGGARGEKAQELAQMLVDEKYPGSDFDFYDLSDDEQMKIYEIALDMVDTGGYKKGGKVIELMPKGILYKGKAKDYPGIKQLIKDMKKKGTRPKKAAGGPMYSEEDFPGIVLSEGGKPKPGLDYYDKYQDSQDSEYDVIEIPMGGKMKKMKKKRKSKADGGLMNLGGKEMDLRGGGFVPMGAKERADDVPARLSKNEFVMTADAVRGAGGGSVQKGADLMYDQMKRLERQG